MWKSGDVTTTQIDHRWSRPEIEEAGSWKLWSTCLEGYCTVYVSTVYLRLTKRARPCRFPGPSSEEPGCGRDQGPKTGSKPQRYYIQ